MHARPHGLVRALHKQGLREQVVQCGWDPAFPLDSRSTACGRDVLARTQSQSRGIPAQPTLDTRDRQRRALVTS